MHRYPGDPNYALWVSPVNDFTGDGTFLPSYFQLDENGDLVLDNQGNPIVNTDAQGNPIGTIFREIRPDNDATPTLVSSDLVNGFTNAWYTTMDRDPFEPVLDSNGDYITGPRWRLQSNKFGQDLPGVEIPLIPHSQPPFQKGNIKYEVGELTTTTINLLDWADGEDSPLRFSNGWTNADPSIVDENGVTVNGLRLTDKLDVAFYIKGDAKATQLYDVRLVLEYEVASTLTVTNTADAGVGSLRAALLAANLNPGLDSINFAIADPGIQTIAPLTALPTLTDPIYVDGSSQTGYTTSTPQIVIDGSAAGAAVDGLRLATVDSTIRGLVIQNFDGDGIEILEGGDHFLTANFLGTDASGNLPQGNGSFGIHIKRSAGNTISDNLLSGNGHSGLALRGDAAAANIIVSNRIGTNLAGTAAVGNQFNGIVLTAAAQQNTIGAAESGNLISGNGLSGVYLAAAAEENLVTENWVGSSGNGLLPLGNGMYGVYILDSAENVIDQNMVSGNGWAGLAWYGSTTTENVLTGNRVGLDVTGTQPLANAFFGVWLAGGANHNRLGGSNAGDTNVISGNGRGGVLFIDSGTSYNEVFGNYIGLNENGTAAVGNGVHGVIFRDGSSQNEVGGSEPGFGNVISGNAQVGVLFEAGTQANLLVGNRIGTNAEGKMAVGNGVYGVHVIDSPQNQISNNQIAGNALGGITIRGPASMFNVVTENLIGRLETQSMGLANNNHGIFVTAGASQNQLGGTTAESGNTIANNQGYGVLIQDESVGNAMRFNSIYDNAFSGIDLGGDGATANDLLDADLGPNLLQNTPVISSAFLSGNMLQMTYRVDTAPTNATYPLQIDFYLADTSGLQGMTYLGSDVFTEADLNAGVKVVDIEVDGLTAGQVVLATATDGDGLQNTSEFSTDLTVVMV